MIKIFRIRTSDTFDGLIKLLFSLKCDILHVLYILTSHSLKVYLF